MSLRNSLDAAADRPGNSMRAVSLLGGGGALIGAVLSFLLFSQTEQQRQDTEILTLLGAISEQAAVIEGRLAEQAEFSQRMSERLNALSRELEKQKRDQRYLRELLAQTATRFYSVSLRAEGAAQGRSLAGERLEAIVAVLMRMETEGDAAFWTARGVPFARTDRLLDVLGWPVSADERDQAASILSAIRRTGGAEQ